MGYHQIDSHTRFLLLTSSLNIMKLLYLAVCSKAIMCLVIGLNGERPTDERLIEMRQNDERLIEERLIEMRQNDERLIEERMNDQERQDEEEETPRSKRKPRILGN